MSSEPSTEDESALGRCPDCRIPIPESELLIRYDSSRGRPKVLAECPRCADVVHPA